MMLSIIGNVIIGIGIIFVALGVYGIHRFKDFYSRILIASKVDTVGIITVLLGVIVKNGLSYFSLKVLLILIFMIIINPLVTHSVARSAYLSGYKIDEKEDKI